MIAVLGHLVVDPSRREAHLLLSAPAVAAARAAPGCLHFAVSADPLDDARVDVAELWATREALDAFRSGPDDGTDPFAHVREFHVRELDVTAAA